jgi:hypothetical protein
MSSVEIPVSHLGEDLGKRLKFAPLTQKEFAALLNIQVEKRKPRLSTGIDC